MRRERDNHRLTASQPLGQQDGKSHTEEEPVLPSRSTYRAASHGNLPFTSKRVNCISFLDNRKGADLKEGFVLL
jgi:hypothetical protein